MDVSGAQHLSDEDLLALSIGRVVRAHTFVDYGLRNVHEALAGPGPKALVGSTIHSTDRLAEVCIVMLRGLDASPQIIESGVGALESARTANLTRNEVIHDMWLPAPNSEPSQRPSWNAFRALSGHLGSIARAEPRDLEFIETAYTALARAKLRVSGLFMALHEVLPRYDDDHRQKRPGSELPRYLALMNDEFTLQSNGDWQVHLDA
jgi:hypothetical protein